MGKNFLQSSIRDSLFTGLVSLALFGPIVGLRTVAQNEILVVTPKWLIVGLIVVVCTCLLYTSPSPRDGLLSRMPSSA